MIIIDEKHQKTFSLSSLEVSFSQLKNLTSNTAEKILRLIVSKPSYPSKIARQLGLHEQVVFYHIRKLEKAKLIKLLKREDKQGGVANYYAITNDGLCTDVNIDWVLFFWSIHWN